MIFLKYISKLSIFVLLFGMVSCSNSGKPGALTPVVEKTDSCLQDTENTYEVYIPGRKSIEEKLPLVLILDAHGSGKFALNKFKLAASNYPVVLVASNRVKNGFPNYSAAVQTLVEDVRQKYPVNETFFLAGFSGGARMALGYSLTHPANGLIMCGALANAAQIRSLHCPVFSISGMDDFNFVETAQYLFQEQSIPENLKIELTNAIHTWPDSTMLSDAFGFLYFTSGNDVSEKQKYKDYCQNQQKRIDGLKAQGDFLKAALIARNMSTTAPFSKNDDFISDYNSLKAAAEYKSRLSKLEKCLKFEISVRKPYLEALTTKDSLWWKKEIRSINLKLSTAQDSLDVDMYRRIKAFWGIACYSLGNQAINGKNAKQLENILPVYKMLEPENPDMFYFSAFPYFWKGKQEETLSMLHKALDAGFSDSDRLKNDFPQNITAELK